MGVKKPEHLQEPVDGKKEKNTKNKGNPQDIKIHKYLLSLANFVEVERVTLHGYQQQVLKGMTRVAEKKFEDQDNKLSDKKDKKLLFISDLKDNKRDKAAAKKQGEDVSSLNTA